MTNETLIPALEDIQLPPGWMPAPELDESIEAKPMVLPDFVHVPLANPTLSARWVFTDRRRFQQAKAQGWRVATKQDIKQGYANLSPFEEEGGTKFINGDLVLMVIKSSIYLGALKYKHQVAAALSDAAVQRRVSGARAAHQMGEQVAAVNRARMAKGADPVMTVFTPGAADLNETALAGAAAAKELGRIGAEGTKREIGTAVDLANELQNARPAASTSE